MTDTVYPVRQLTFLGSMAALATLLWTSCSLVNQDLPNESPIIQVSEADTTVVKRGGRVKLTVTASDEDDDPLRYEWNAFGAGTLTDPLKNSTFWIAPEQISGESQTFKISVFIIDSNEDTVDPFETFDIEVVQRPPVLAAPGDTVVSFSLPEIVLQARASDEDHDALSFAWELLEGGLTAEQLILRTTTKDSVSTVNMLPLAPGDALLAVSATDGSDTVRVEFAVSINARAQPDSGMDAGMIALELSDPGGVSLPYEIDVYEYPNQRGMEPLLVDDWFQASALCLAQGKRLCSSLEWVYACQGPEGNAYSSVEDRDTLPATYGLRFCNGIGSALASDSPAFDEVAPSGSFPNCASSTGVYDLSGNAAEWLMIVDDDGIRHGSASLSSTLSVDSCGALGPPQPGIPSATEMDDADRAVVDALLAIPGNDGYARLHRGFRCCR